MLDKILGLENIDIHLFLQNQHGLKIVHVEEALSAQQSVYILTVKSNETEQDDETVSFPTTCTDQELLHHHHHHHQDLRRQRQQLSDALIAGQGRIVARVWKAGARWWNMNSNASTSIGGCRSFLQLAKAEVTGYRVAKRALDAYNAKCDHSPNNNHNHTNRSVSVRWKPTHVCIPQVLYFSHDPHGDIDADQSSTSALEKQQKAQHQDESGLPWALFSYVGTHRTFYNPPNGTSIHVRVPSLTHSHEPYKYYEHEPHHPEEETLRVVHCSKFIRKMVKIRHEFGFDEPHPRHGRVCVEQALEYAMHVLDVIVLPLHFSFFDDSYCTESRSQKPYPQSTRTNADDKAGVLEEGSQYMGHITGKMLGTRTVPFSQRPQQKYSGLFNRDEGINLIGKDTDWKKDGINHLSYWKYQDMVCLYRDCISRLLDGQKTLAKDDFCGKRMDMLIQLLIESVNRLESESNEIPHLQLDHNIPPVLCHMDLQPQNMILCRRPTPMDSDDGIPLIMSVLDWEEACYSDPRFELLLLCRKVVANRSQADTLWSYYSNSMQERYRLGIDYFGPIEPWLKLETVHSVITLSMQGMDLQEGGRNPWERKPDLWDKISRELSRLVELGWDFCRRSNDEVDNC